MNWLDLDEVRAWLAEHERQRELRPDEWATDMEWGQGEFVAALAAESDEYPVGTTAYVHSELCVMHWAVARLLRDAMEGKTK